jgi:hypothetical protein
LYVNGKLACNEKIVRKYREEGTYSSRTDMTSLHKPSLVGPPSMRDDICSYLLPLLLQLFQIFNVCLNRVFEEFILVIFSHVIESLQG